MNLSISYNTPLSRMICRAMTLLLMAPMVRPSGLELRKK